MCWGRLSPGKRRKHASVSGMSNFSETAVKQAGGDLDRLNLTNSWRAIVPVAITAPLALTPAPVGLAQHAWYYFAIFAGVIVALISEPLPGAAVGLIGVAVVTALAPTVLYGPAELAKPGFNPADAALTWALAGFSNATVWPIIAAFLFALAGEKCGLGGRIRPSPHEAAGSSIRSCVTCPFCMTQSRTIHRRGGLVPM
jgi:di/tricarboxylate transporter